MTHIEYWLSDDGTRFEDKYYCALYELKQSLKYTAIRVTGQNGIRYSGPSIMDQNIYNESEGVIIPDVQALLDMKRIQEFTGFYSDINDVGTWMYMHADNRWEKIA